jgi:hypothetical protein
MRCSGSMTFWGGSGSSYPCFWLMDPDSDPESGYCYFRHWPSRRQQKTNLTQFFLLITFWRYQVHLHHFSKIKSQKESQNRRNQGFFCLIEGSGAESIPLTSGSGRPKNMWIQWIRNTAQMFVSDPVFFIPDPSGFGSQAKKAVDSGSETLAKLCQI